MRDEMQVKIVKKGEDITMPINHSGYQWVTMTASSNGIVLTIGPSGGFGVFISEERLREIINQFNEEIQK